MKAADYLEDLEFRGFCKVWEDQVRIPLGFPDWLRDRDLIKQAENGDWAFNKPDRKGFGGPTPRCVLYDNIYGYGK